MIGAGIFDGSTLIVDRGLKPKSSSIVIADVDGEWMVKRLYKRGGTVKLLSENPEHGLIVLAEGQELIVFGVVTLCHSPAKISPYTHSVMLILFMHPARKYLDQT